MAEDSRFERIERHLDDLSKDIKELTKVVADLARIEERMVTLFKRMDSLDGRQGKVEDRVTGLEKISGNRGVVFQIVEKIFYLAIGGLIAFISKGGFG